MELITLIENFFKQRIVHKKNILIGTGSTSLGQYFQSSMSSHYEWAYKKIKLHKKNLRTMRFFIFIISFLNLIISVSKFY
ncbi:ClbS/DfsB family four-helix bundle protein [Lactococcus lactis]|uniref:ClbS/DfsB family four-helix bundle protein n=1 Tax=Lactococcus lactis TaxID=1358 RepID=UPI0030F453FF